MRATSPAFQAEAEAARNVLRLCVGRTPSAQLDAATWRHVADVAVRHRCGPLAWHLGRDTIRRAAPDDVVQRLRAHAIERTVAARRRADLAATLIAAFTRAGVRGFVHKGIALSTRLHGDPFLRPGADLDLVVRPDGRAEARRVVLALGFRQVEGAAPAEEAFEGLWQGRGERVEVHSRYLGDKLAHLPQPIPEPVLLAIDGVRLPAAPPAVAAAAAIAHFGAEWKVPLLLLLDLHALWARMDEDSTFARDVRAQVARARLGGYYEHAARSVMLVRAALDDDLTRAHAALEALRVGGPIGATRHPALRALRLAESWRDRRAALVAWTRGAGTPAAGLRGLGVIARRARRALRRSDEVVPSGVVRSLAASPEELVALVRDVVAARGRCWIAARGRSMTPAIPAGASLLLAPPPPRRLARGEVVLASLPDGAVVVHRVVTDDGTSVTLRGDANVLIDAPLARSAVHAIVERVRIGDREELVALRPGPSLPMRLRQARAAFASNGGAWSRGATR